MCSNIVDYADDNHIYYKNKSTEAMCKVLRLDTNNAISWFEQNYINLKVLCITLDDTLKFDEEGVHFLHESNRVLIYKSFVLSTFSSFLAK